MKMRIGYPHPDRLISYPDPHNLSIWRQPIRMRSRRRHRWTILEGNALGRAWLRCPWAAAGPGWASRRRITAQHRRRRRCGGRRRVRRARAGFEIDHSEPLGSRVAISRAAGTDGARNTSGATSNKLNHAFQPHHWCGGRRRVRRAQEGLAAVPVGGGGAWPDNEPTRRATHQRPGAAGVEGAGGSGGHGRASRSTTPSRRLACGDLAGGPPPTGTHSGRALRRPEHQRHHKHRAKS